MNDTKKNKKTQSIGEMKRLRAQGAGDPSWNCDRFPGLLAAYLKLTMGLSLEAIARSTLGFLKDELGIAYASIALLVQDRAEFRLFSVAPMEIEGLESGDHVPVANTFLSEVVGQHEPCYRSDLAALDSAWPVDGQLLAAGLRSDFLVPLWIEDRCLGTLNLASPQPDGFTAQQRQFIPLLAPSLAHAIHNGLLFVSLQESEERQRALFQTATQGIIHHDASGRIVAANPAAEQILGLTFGQMQRRALADLLWRAVREDGAEFPREALPSVRALETGQAVRNVVMGIFSPVDEICRWVLVSAVPQFDSAGQAPCQVHTTFADITARKQAEDALRESYRLLEGTVANLEEAVFVMDPLTRGIISCNPAAVHIFGHEKEDIVGRDAGFLHVDRVAYEQFRQQLQRDLDNTGVFCAEMTMKRKNGEIFFTENTVTDIRDEKGFCRASVRVIRDITERKRRIDALRASETRFRTLVEQSPFSIQVLSPDGWTLRVNRAWEKLWGMPRESVANYNILNDHRLAKKGVLPYIRRGFGGEVTEIPPVAYRRQERSDDSSGERWVRGFVYPVTDEAGRIIEVILMHEDITERKKAEERLRLSLKVVESTAEGITVTDADNRVIAVNRAYAEITGYGEEEVLGQNPGIVKSRVHDRQFYAQMWASIAEAGCWQGEILNRRKNGEIFPTWTTISAVRDERGKVTNYVSVFSDISSIKRSQEELDFLAHHDPLTHLPNRLLFNDRLEHALQRAHREGNQVAVLFLDMDRFKNINDSLGHPIGDLLLQKAAQRLKSLVREEDTVARLGGDEFVIILEDVREAQGVATLAGKLVEAFAQPFMVKEHELHLSLSVGISLYPRDGEDSATLVKNADAAMYRAKEGGRNGYQFYTRALTATVCERLTLETALRRALEKNELEVYYQPQYAFDTGRLVGAEALLRWRHPELGLISPDRFIPLAEDSGLIVAIGNWALHTACTQMRAWQQAGYGLERIAVNVSSVQFQRCNMLEMVRNALDDTGLRPEHLELELTESFLMEKADSAVVVLDNLKALGVKMTIDDFGTGYSSLSYLKRLPVDKLKIDRSFVRDIPNNPNDEAITRAVISLAQNLQMKVVAEGVETEKQRAFLVAEGCHEGQGYLYSRPVTAEQFVRLFG